MAGVNKALIIGRLGADPEMRTITNGQNVAQLSVATSENWTDRDGQRQERTEWHRVVVWGKLAEICGKYLAKGREVFIEGRIQTRSWEDQQGQKRYTTEIVANNVQFIGSRPTDQKDNTTNMNNDENLGNFGSEPSIDTSEEIPF